MERTSPSFPVIGSAIYGEVSTAHTATIAASFSALHWHFPKLLKRAILPGPTCLVFPVLKFHLKPLSCLHLVAFAEKFEVLFMFNSRRHGSPITDPFDKTLVFIPAVYLPFVLHNMRASRRPVHPRGLSPAPSRGIFV